MLRQGASAAAVLLLLGCTHDPLVEAQVYPGLVEVARPTGELLPMLFSADDVPARQSLLYVAMYEAAVAAQNAGLARGSPRVEEVKTRVGEVLYAIDPQVAPPWWAKSTGFVEVWAGSGYGLRRAARRMIEEIDAALASGTASGALSEYGPRAIRCVENALERSDQVVALGQEVLAAPPEADIDPVLRELEQVALALNDGVPSPSAQGCGLKQAFLYLSQVGVDVAEEETPPKTS